jgi:hypothetical protein
MQQSGRITNASISSMRRRLQCPHGWHVNRRVACLDLRSILRMLLPTIDCQSSQMAIALPAVVPLWKVMVGSRADNYNRTRKGPVFRWPAAIVARDSARARFRLHSFAT